MPILIYIYIYKDMVRVCKLDMRHHHHLKVVGFLEFKIWSALNWQDILNQPILIFFNGVISTLNQPKKGKEIIYET